ncbi:F-box associated domain containing protein [Tanacetum coccineum]|uniref:F-box associated domain containing protein n=1 Tax=Tanacetum coccineum TaxID=301880 RepID=A0ABQ5H4W4_9ASTR
MLLVSDFTRALRVGEGGGSLVDRSDKLYDLYQLSCRFRGFFWKAARIGERLSPWVACLYHFIFESNDGSLYSVPYNNHEALSTQTKLDLQFYRINYILGYVNGLVFASSTKLHNKDYVHLVLNLTTKDYVELPNLSQEFDFGMDGFGYDSVSDDYKVVHISGLNSCVDVYSVRTNTWKLVSHSSYDYYKTWLGVFVNGFLHWIVKNHSKPVIVAFSLADEKLSELLPPNLYNEVDMVSHRYTKLVALGDKLAIFNEVKGDVWLMNEYGVQKSWTKIVVHGFSKNPMVKPKVFFDNGKILFLTGELLSVYDVEKGTFCKSVDISYMNLRKVMGAYVESLVSPKFSKSS